MVRQRNTSVVPYWLVRRAAPIAVLSLANDVIAFVSPSPTRCCPEHTNPEMVAASPLFRRGGTVLYGKRGKRSKGSKRPKKSTEASSAASQPIGSVSTATQRSPASMAGIVEDHRYEQFFYDEQTCRQIYQLVDQYEQPLLLCNPSLAVLAQQKNRPYLLLDRDERLDFLDHYQRFSLTEPYLITNYKYDAVFVDPPFANVTPQQLAQCLSLMAPDRERATTPLFVAYNSRREEALLQALHEQLDCPRLGRLFSLGYREGVKDTTQDTIWLYGPTIL